MSSSHGVSAETLKSISTPDQVESRLGTLEFDDGAPSEETAALLYDNLDFQNGVQAFLGAFLAHRSRPSTGGSSRSASRTTRSSCSRS
jgi:hypothetical protein